MTFNFWFKWMITVSFLTILFGFILILFNHTNFFNAIFNIPINETFWHVSSVDTPTQIFQQWVYGTMGAILVGWGTTLTFISAHPFRSKESWAWNCLMMSVLLWFITDTTISLYFKVYVNVITNSLLFVAFLIPLIFTKKFFK